MVVGVKAGWIESTIVGSVMAHTHMQPTNDLRLSWPALPTYAPRRMLSTWRGSGPSGAEAAGVRTTGPLLALASGPLQRRPQMAHEALVAAGAAARRRQRPLQLLSTHCV